MRVVPIVASTFFSDGGTMFGLVPKTIWAKLLPPNERNGIPQNANVLFLELNDGRKGLVDTGCGPDINFTGRELSLNGLGSGWPLREALGRLDTRPEDLDFILFSHLHWDHAGGAVLRETSGSLAAAFPRALHYIHADEWADAASGNPLLYKSYPDLVVRGLRQVPESRRVLVRDEAPDILPGVKLLRSSGHTRGHCVVELRGDAIRVEHPQGALLGPVSRITFAGDVCPTQHHLRMVFQTSYDTAPLDTRAWKRRWLPGIAAEKSLLFFDHDPALFGGVIRTDESREFVVERGLAVHGR